MTKTRSLFTYTSIALIGGAMLLTTAANVEARGMKDRERPTFSQLDADGNGEITVEELSNRGAARFAEADSDGNGELSREELLARSEGANERRVDRMLERADSDGNGALSQAEIEAMREARGGGNRGAERIAKMMERVDTDGSGTISQAEYDAAIAKRAERAQTQGE